MSSPSASGLTTQAAGKAASFLLGLAGLGVAAWGVAANLRSQGAAQGHPPELPPLQGAAGPDQVSLPAFAPPAAPSALDRSLQLLTERPQRPRVEVVKYTVQPGDSVFGIADHFGLQPETVLWGNLQQLQDDPHALRPGQELNILPVDGAYHQWQAGDTLGEVAASFQVQPDSILDWPGNGVSPVDPQIAFGDWLVIPGGKRQFQTWLVPTIPRGRAGVGAAVGAGVCEGDFSGGAVGSGGFIWPASNHSVSGNDYWSGHLAIDIAAGPGEGVWAADGGVVVFAGWSYGGYGQLVMLDHGNGWQTVYAHLSQIDVLCGQSLGQGQRLGLAGSTGNSTGAHLHFETRFEDGFVNPWFVLP